MKMLLVLFDKQGQILLCRNESVYFVPTVAENLKIGEIASQLSFHRFMELGYLGVHFSVTRSRAASAFFSSAAW